MRKIRAHYRYHYSVKVRLFEKSKTIIRTHCLYKREYIPGRYIDVTGSQA